MTEVSGFQESYSFFETIQVQVATCRAKANKLSKSLETLFSVDSGPLTLNVVLISAQRVHRFKRSAALTFEIPISFTSG
jgi:hypothetical protein